MPSARIARRVSTESSLYTGQCAYTCGTIALSKDCTYADLILIPDSNQFDLYLEDWELTIGAVRFGQVCGLCRTLTVLANVKGQFHMVPLRFTVSVVQDLPNGV